MAFIKRSTVTPVHAKVGKKMLKCSSCGVPFVSKTSTNLCGLLCPSCRVPPNVNDDTLAEGIPNVDTDTKPD